jgi:DNA-binding NarL/FixJ family response regulator
MRKNDHSRTHRTTRENPYRLTDREIEVADAMVRYGCIKAIAKELGIAKHTAATHTIRVAKKMGLANRWLAAIAWDRYRRQPVKVTVANSVFQMADRMAA